MLQNQLRQAAACFSKDSEVFATDDLGPLSEVCLLQGRIGRMGCAGEAKNQKVN